MRKPFKTVSSVGLVVIGAIAVFGAVAAVLAHPQRQVYANASAAPASTCAQPAVAAAEKRYSTVDPDTSLVIPAGEPTVVAMVNGIPISAAQFEAQVAETQRGNQQTASTLPADAPSAVRAAVTESTGQLRQSVLHQMIMSILWLEAGKHSNLGASTADVRAFMAKQVQTSHGLAAADPSRIAFEAFLCARGLSEQTYLTNPHLIASYRDVLTMAAARKQFLASLPTAQAQDPAAVLHAHEQAMWNAASIQVFVTY